MSSLRIAICEDSDSDAKILEHYLLELDKTNRIQVFSSSEEFLQFFQKGMFQLIFFDIYMGGMTGIDAAKILRKIDEEVSMVFTTTSEDFALESYKVSALHYLTKPLSMENVAEVLARYKKKRETVKTHTKLIIKGEHTPVLLENIMYVEVFGKELHIHTTDTVIVSNQLLGNLLKQLSSLPFLHCHRAYIVNLDYVADIAEDFLMENGDKVYIRRRDYHKVKSVYLDYLLETL